MKLTFLLLTAAFLNAYSAGMAQRVTLTVSNTPLEKVFTSVEKQTGYVFFFDESILKDTKPVTVRVFDMPLEDFLNIILKDQHLKFSFENKTIVISSIPQLPRAPERQPSIIAPPPVDISGSVTDTLGNPLIGASVSIKGIGATVQTDSKGNFRFPNVPEGKYKLVVSYIGYERSETTISFDGTVLNIKIVLNHSTSQLDQVRVIAYGTDSRRFSVGSVSTVTADDIEKQPVANPLLALQGLVPGLAVNATSGIPGSQVLVQVRGQNTLNLNPDVLTTKPYDQPLFIIDGVPFAAQNSNVSQFASLVTAQGYSAGISQSVGISPFNNINPADIESVSILKDADATSIYGTQGSNGVILITTKKGKAGATSFDVNVRTGFNTVSRPVKLMNTEQYLQMRKDAYAADGITPSSDPGNYLAYAPDITIYDQSKYTNWQKIIYGQTTNNTDVHASLSGGSGNNTFLISTGYTRSTYNYPGDFADERYTIHSNIHHNSKDYRLTVDLTTDYGYDHNKSAGFDGGNDIILSPNLPDLLDASGNLLWNYKAVDLTSSQFYASLKQPTNLHNYNFNTAFNISYKLFQGLTIGANLGYNRNSTNENSINPAVAQNPAYISRQANFSTNTFQAVNIEPQINYKRVFGKSNINAVVGGTYKKNTTGSTYTTGTGYANDNFLGSINGAPSVSAMDATNIYRYNAGFARLNYIYDQKYILDLTVRRDGSSNFGPGRQFGNFGSVGAGWIFSGENLVKKLLPVLSYGKLSGSYGTSGSDGIQAYQYQSLYKTISFVPTFQGITPSSAYNLYNPDYSWALKKSLNIAFDLGFFDNRLLLNATYYRNREGNQLANYPLPIQSGISAVLGNLPAVVQNKGYEFAISSTNIKTKKFTWKTNFNLSFNRNKLLSFPNLDASSYAAMYEVGQPTSIKFGYKYAGINPTTGQYEFYTKGGDRVTNPTYGLASMGGDQVPVADGQIKYMGGIGNTFTWKQFNLYIFCQFSSQNAPNYLAQVYSTPAGLMANQPAAVADNYWKKLKKESLSVKFEGHDIADMSNQSLSQLMEIFTPYAQGKLLKKEKDAHPEKAIVAQNIAVDLVARLKIMIDLGLGYLSLERSTPTISPGELQRLRLATQVHSNLFGVIYVLDEPSAGLHPADTEALLKVLQKLKDAGNSMFIVEHEVDIIRHCDWIVDVGPQAGTNGGEILYSGPLEGLQSIKPSVTRRFIEPEPLARTTIRKPTGWLHLAHVTRNNIQDLSVSFPLGVLISVTGTSGSGKSSLVSQALVELVADYLGQELNESKDEQPELLQEEVIQTSGQITDGMQHIKRLVRVDQKPIGRTSRSNLATYTGLFDRVRQLFANTALAKSRRYDVGRFSFNVAKGRCPICKGEGFVMVELLFLPSVYAPCPSCKGTRYNDKTLEVKYENKNIAEVLDMTVDEAWEFFKMDNSLRQSLDVLRQVGLGYIRLGQPATELSGGEAQRIKLATELQRTQRGKTLYVLDEPTTGLHPSDVEQLVGQLNFLVDAGNTVITIEHDMHVVATSDWVIDLGPGAGKDGGKIVAMGTPGEVAVNKQSKTALYLAPYI